jgi:HEAT repeat protein
MKRALLLGLIFAARLVCQTDTDTVNAWSVIETALTDKSADTRAKAAFVLGLIENSSKAQSDAEKALTDSDSRVRAAAARALGAMGAKSSIPKLKALIKDDQSEVVFAVASALRKLDDPTAFEIYYAALTGERKSGESLAEQQMKILKDPKALSKIGFEAGIGFVPFGGAGLAGYKMLTKDDATPVRAAAATQLVADPDPRAAKALVAALADDKWLVRAAAADAIAQRNDPTLKHSLTPVFLDSKDTVRFTAAAAYLRLNGKSGGRGK